MLTRKGDHVYGRGTTDDKGPVIEALYAMKLLRDSGVKLNKRVRLIMGCMRRPVPNVWNIIIKLPKSYPAVLHRMRISHVSMVKGPYVHDGIFQTYQNYFYEWRLCIQCGVR